MSLELKDQQCNSLRKSRTPNFRTVQPPIEHKFIMDPPNLFDTNDEDVYFSHKRSMKAEGEGEAGGKNRALLERQEELKNIIQRPIVKLEYNPRTYNSTTSSQNDPNP